MAEYEYMGGVSDVSPVYAVMDVVQPVLTSSNELIIHKRHHAHTPGQNSEYQTLIQGPLKQLTTYQQTK